MFGAIVGCCVLWNRTIVVIDSLDYIFIGALCHTNWNGVFHDLNIDSQFVFGSVGMAFCWWYKLNSVQSSSSLFCCLHKLSFRIFVIEVCGCSTDTKWDDSSSQKELIHTFMTHSIQHIQFNTFFFAKHSTHLHKNDRSFDV